MIFFFNFSVYIQVVGADVSLSVRKNPGGPHASSLTDCIYLTLKTPFPIPCLIKPCTG